MNVGLTAAAKSLQSCPTLCSPIDGSPPGSTVPGILQARTLEWVAISFSNAWKWKVKVKLLSRVRLCATPWTALLGSSIHGIFQARVLEWVAIAFSVGLTGWMLICISLGTLFALNIWLVVFVEGREWVNREGRWAQGDGQGGWSKVILQYSAPVRWFRWGTAMWRSAWEKQEVKFKDQLGGFRRCSAKRGWDSAQS